MAPKGKKTELQCYFDSLVNQQKPCEVCAKGALFLSSIRKYNNVSLAEVEDVSLDGMASEKVINIFGRKNADLMESYFENGNPDFDNDEDDERDDLFRTDPWLDLSDHARLIVIIKNAIRNNGIFKPEQEKQLK